MEGVSAVLGNAGKKGFGQLLHECQHRSSGTAGSSGVLPDNRTRHFLKIQDGCNGSCTYCIVPRARGASRSIPPAEAERSFELLAASGSPEVVLSGIHIGRYGADLEPETSLTDLVQRLAARGTGTRLRISSIEPREVTPGIIRLLGNGLTRHLHIPLQSGDDRTLESMNRDYTAAFYRDLVRQIAADVPDVAIGADVMVGFPGEGEREFENTRKLIEDLPLTHLHVFSFSARPGTPAAAMRGQVRDQVKRERSESLRKLGWKKNAAFRMSMIGKHLHTVIQSPAPSGGHTGLTDNYIPLIVQGVPGDAVSTCMQVLIESVDGDLTIGRASANLLINKK